MGDQQVSAIVSALGGLGNIASAANCMTRLRVTVADEALVDEAGIKQNPAVLGVVHDQHAYYEIVVGPGKAKTFANKVQDMLKNPAAGAVASAFVTASATAASAQAAEAAKVAGTEKVVEAADPTDEKPSLSARIKHFCKILGGIFVPMIPGFIVSGICGSFAMIIQQLVPGYSDNVVWGCLYNLLFLIQQSLLAYLTAWTGYRAAEQFGATPVLGGMLGMITSMSNINDIATFLGLYNADSPLSSILMTGKGGVLAVVVGVFLLAKVERLVDNHMPDVLKVIGTPLVTMLICTAFYVLAIMPAAGFVASWLCAGMNAICMSDHVIVRIITGYLGAALFLPLVALGMHHGLVALYAIQLESIGYVTLYPALCMAGAGQVGAAIAIRHKAKKCGNTKVVAIADAGIPAGFLGVGEPLVYSLTLPMGKPFITAGLGAGFGGAFVMFMQVAATAWGPSGLLGLCVMDAGPAGMTTSLGSYAIGLAISYVMGFIITNALVKEEEVAELYRDETPDAQQVADSSSPDPTAPQASSYVGQVADSSAPAPTASQTPTASENGGFSPVESPAGPTIIHGQPVALEGMILLAPADGQIIAQKHISDKTFREGYLGSCFGIVPSEGVVYAPCSGTVALETESHYAFVIEDTQGQRVMIHVGIGTVNMNGEGFEPLVDQGDSVEAGERLLNFDRALVRARGYEDTIITALMENA
ncbi:MAG: PTS glucose transporter subunit IIA [Eggerthellaceae bacterium]|nr:PTS glucose transporter subunit IIA [Eggerthellaceae bacterium]